MAKKTGKTSKLLVVAASAVIMLVLVAVLAPWISPYDPLAQDILARLKGPSAAHWLGADQFGRDLLSRLIHGLRASLGISAAAVIVALLIGGTLGLVAAYYRGWTER
ncbi:N-terminal TM domain of oligopeptide transport permease C, partial [Bosea sp. OK403]